MSDNMTRFRHVGLIFLAVLIVASMSVCASAVENNITLKWSINFSNSNYAQIMPVMGDIDNDGTQEIVLAAGGLILAIDGKNGTIEWNQTGSWGTAPELVDLNNDGVPEVLYGMAGPRVRAVNGNGSIRWTSVKLKGEGQPVNPLVAYDIDGDGYPTIYFTAEDESAENESLPYNRSDYNGSLNMLDHNGNLLADTWLFHPCWGGPAIGDPNSDGNFIVFVSDRRRAGYLDGKTANGLQAFDAKTLQPLWQRPDIQHSSPLPILADVDNDGIQELIAEKITLAGPMILNATTGVTIKDYSNLRLPTHGVGTVYDIDRDGNLEIMMGTSYPDAAPADFAVFDLVTGQTEFRPNFSYHASWPPKAGDVFGDSDMEILAAMGNQGNTSDYPLLIYDKNYTLIFNISIKGAGQLMPARVYDTDSDGYNEIVVAGFRGKLLVYDTPALTPSPAPRTWVQHYSEARMGAAEYVPLPGPKAPVIRNAYPADGAQNISLGTKLSFWTYDYQKDLIDITFELNNGSGWQVIGSFDDVGRGNYSVDTEGYVNEYNAQYRWRVTTDDDNGHTDQETFTFFTFTPSSSWTMPGWRYMKQVTVNHSMVASDLSGFPLLVDVFIDPDNAQADGDDFLFTSSDGFTKIAHEIERYDSATGHLIAWVNVPFLSASENTVLFMYYGNPDADNQQDAEGVWDSNYLAVHHLEEIAGNVTDSTANGNDGTPKNGVLMDVLGKIDGGDWFDGTDDSTQLPIIFTTQGQFTIEGWYSTEPKSDFMQTYILSQRDTYARQGVLFQYFPNGTLQMLVDNQSVSVKTSTGGSLHYFAGTFDGTTASLYVDNNLSAMTASTLAWPANATFIGNGIYGNRAFNGTLDEIRLSDIARGQAYARTSFNNQNNPVAFAVFGIEQAAWPKPIISGIYPVYQVRDVPVDVELGFDLVDHQNDTMDYTITTSPDVGFDAATGVDNGHYTLSLNDLDYGKEYFWYVNVTDGEYWNRQAFSFTTVYAYNLTNDVKGDGHVSFSTPPPYINGTVLELTANADAGREFLGWCGDLSGNMNPASLMMNSDKKVSAFFKDSSSLLIDSSFDYSVDSADLRRDCGFQKWYESRLDNQNLVVLDENNVAGNSGKKAKLEQSTSGNAYLSQGFTPQSGSLTIKWDIYVDTIQDYLDFDTAALQFIGTDLDGSNPNGKSSERFVILGFYHANGSAEQGASMNLVALEPPSSKNISKNDSNMYNSSQWTTLASGLEMDHWYTIKAEFDLAAFTYDIYIDGISAASDIHAYSNLTNISHISFATWNDAVGGFYVDNVVGSNGFLPADCIDHDSDGYGNNCVAGPDCDDSDSSIHPNAGDYACNGVDNDCDGQEDEDYSVTPTDCGFGVCYANGELRCIAGSETDTCVPGIPAADDATCDNIDDDCDGSVDEHYAITFTSCGIGACFASGETVCRDGNVQDTCAPGTPGFEECDTDFVDENCDGISNEGCSCEDGDARSCGSDEGECVSGTQTCASGVWSSECDGAISPIAELCDGLDNDCDGPSDEDWSVLGDLCTSGFGVCEASGNYVCKSDGSGSECDAIAGSPAGLDDDCNGIDEDCDGISDSNFLSVPLTCGVGECQETGNRICLGGSVVDSCTPSLPSLEVCDGLDNDCDGSADEELTCGCINGQAQACVDSNGCSGGVQTCVDGNWGSCIATKYYCDSNCDGLNECSDAACSSCINCAENWTCTDWTTCSDGSQSRTCVDSNLCNTTVNKPIETQGCTVARVGGGGGGGGGGSSYSNELNWNCGEWSVCVNSKQSQVCKHKTQNAEKTNTRSCTVVAPAPQPAVVKPVVVEESSSAAGEADLASQAAADQTGETENTNAAKEDSQAAVPEITGAVAGATAKGSSVWWLVAIAAVLAVILSLYFVIKKVARKGQY